MKKYFIFLLIITLVLIVGYAVFLKGGTSESLQHDFDIIRLRDLAQLSGYIEKYKNIAGKYPFEGDVDMPHYVHIHTKQQEKYANSGPPYKHKRTGVQDFIKELKSKIGDDIEIPFDLQKVPVNKPNFYIYI